MMGGRRKRSASQPIGTMPRTRKPPEIPATKVMAPVETWKDDWMFGERTASPEVWRLSSVTMMARMMKVREPAGAQPVAAGMVCSSPDPGQHVLGEEDLRRRFGCQLSLGGRIDDQVGQVGRAQGVGGIRSRPASGRRLTHRRSDLR